MALGASIALDSRHPLHLAVNLIHRQKIVHGQDVARDYNRRFSGGV
jgi:hypothetical protein